MKVVDAAAVVDALTGSHGCAELRNHLVVEELHAPALLDFEFVSALRGLTLTGHLTSARASDALTDSKPCPSTAGILATHSADVRTDSGRT